MREFGERMKIISHCPIKVFVASYIPRYWYPYRLQHAGQAETWLADESLETILDSGISDDSIGNTETLDKAHELNADYVVPADTLNNQSATTEAVHDFLDLYDSHPCTATPMIPLQPPYDQHYNDLDGFSHYVLGGIATSDPETQLTELRRFRDAAGAHVYAHALGLGASTTLIEAFRDAPNLVDSFDLSTTEKLVTNDRIADSTWKHDQFAYPRGECSSTIRAAYASAAVLQLNYMLGPFYDPDATTAPAVLREPGQAGLMDAFAVPDGGGSDA